MKICEKWYYPILCVCIQPVRSPVRAVVRDKPEFYPKVMKTRMKCAKSRNVLPRNGRQQAWKAVCHVYFYDVKRVSGVNGIVCMHTTVPSPKVQQLPRAELGILHGEACTKKWYESNLELLQAMWSIV